MLTDGWHGWKYPLIYIIQFLLRHCLERSLFKSILGLFYRLQRQTDFSITYSKKGVIKTSSQTGEIIIKDTDKFDAYITISSKKKNSRAKNSIVFNVQETSSIESRENRSWQGLRNQSLHEIRS